MPCTTGLSCARPRDPVSRASGVDPCLVTAARDGARYVLLDLAAARVTTLVGEPTAVAEAAALLVDEVCSGRWSRARGVHAAGFGTCPSGARLATLEELVSGDLQDTGGLVLLGPACAGSARARELIATATNGHGAPLVACFEVHGAGGRLEARDEPVAESPALLGPDDPGPLAPVEVAVLGPVEIRASAESLEGRPKLTELVVYLALHPEGRTTAAWTAALWPDRRVPPQTIANRLSEARRALGIAPDGRPRLRRTGDRHQLVGVDTDWAAFSTLAGETRDPRSWRRALELVRGRPFEGLDERQWCHLEGLVSEIEIGVVDCALRLGRHLLGDGDHLGAEWAASRGIKACPFDERLHRLLMRAADAAGNRAGVRAAFRQLGLVLEIDGDPRRGVHPQTAALYDRLAGGRSGG